MLQSARVGDCLHWDGVGQSNFQFVLTNTRSSFGFFTLWKIPSLSVECKRTRYSQLHFHHRKLNFIFFLHNIWLLYQNRGS